MADVIRLLPDYVANQIAAGEVVQRPASMVKELLENAIDAKANRIKLIVKDSGKTLVQVVDDGTGMSATDARMAFERHATSKIRNAEDLFDIRTKGFRGEALASIAAVSQLECITKLERDELGTRLLIEGGKLMSQESAASPTGTSIIVKNLFYNIPARRNFLKNNQVEFHHIFSEFQRVALAHPEVEFELAHDKTNVSRLEKSSERQRIIDLFGYKTSEKLIPIKEQTDFVKISGFVLKPQFAKKTKAEQFFFVNHRFIKSSYLNHAVMSAFEGLIERESRPSYFLFLEAPPKSIDINIHPTKTEIKFDNEQAVYAILRSAVKHSLGQYGIAPTLDFTSEDKVELPYSYRNKQPLPPTIQISKNFNPFKSHGSDTRTHFSGTLVDSARPSWEALYAAPQADGNIFENSEVEKIPSLINATELAGGEVLIINNQYIAVKRNDSLVIISCTAARRRLFYDDFKVRFLGRENACQRLLFPLSLTFSKLELQALSQIQKMLERVGFELEITSDAAIVNGMPAKMSEADLKSVFEGLADPHRSYAQDAEASMADYIALRVCKGVSFSADSQLSPTAAKELADSLFQSSDPQVCPLKKPIFIKWSFADIDKQFK